MPKSTAEGGVWGEAVEEVEAAVHLGLEGLGSASEREVAAGLRADLPLLRFGELLDHAVELVAHCLGGDAGGRAFEVLGVALAELPAGGLERVPWWSGRVRGET